MPELPDPVADALRVAERYGQTDGAHHKAWVIDQMVRALTGDGYEAWLAEYRIHPSGDACWDEGIAP
jgi:hypothetical protein